MLQKKYKQSYSSVSGPASCRPKLKKTPTLAELKIAKQRKRGLETIRDAVKVAERIKENSAPNNLITPSQHV